MASADLGGLGAKEGAPTEYTWTPPSMLPQLVPWMAILILLLLPANRCAHAWWVWAPLLAVQGVAAGLRPVIESIAGSIYDPASQTFTALAFGLAALWLGSPYLGRKSRWIAFFAILLTVAGFGAATLFLRQNGEQEFMETGAFAMFTGFCALQVALALSLTAIVCRRRFGAVRFALWLALLLAAGWLLVTAPFVVITSQMDGGPAWNEFLGGILAVAGITYLVLLPFLLLALAQPFYRSRFLNLLRFPPPANTALG